jgi:hypothetical protein
MVARKFCTLVAGVRIPYGPRLVLLVFAVGHEVIKVPPRLAKDPLKN